MNYIAKHKRTGREYIITAEQKEQYQANPISRHKYTFTETDSKTIKLNDVEEIKEPKEAKKAKKTK